MAPAYKLTYFDGQGIAETIRYLFHYAGIEFDDVRMERNSWPEHKSKFPFGQLPILEHNGKIYHQSLAIARFVAKHCDLAGKNNFEDMEIDGIAETIMDLRTQYAIIVYGNDEAKQETLYRETIPYYLDRFTNLTKQNNGFLAVGRLSWADVMFVAMLDYMSLKSNKNLFENYQELTALKKKVLNLPNIKTYIENRPKTDF